MRRVGLILALITAMVVAGCSTGTKAPEPAAKAAEPAAEAAAQDSQTPEPAKLTPEEVVERYLAAERAFDLEEAKTYLAEEAVEELQQLEANLDTLAPMFKAAMKKTSEVVRSAEISGDRARVPYEVVTPDPEAIIELTKQAILTRMADVNPNSLSDEEVDAVITATMVELVEADDAPMMTIDGTATLIQENGEWKILTTEMNQ